MVNRTYFRSIRIESEAFGSIPLGSKIFGAALLCAALGVGCASSAYRTATAADRDLSRRANQALEEAGLDTHRVEARAYRGVVVLLGEAESGEVRDAQQTVLALPGVVRVNNMVLSGGPSTSPGLSRAKRAPIVARAQTAE